MSLQDTPPNRMFVGEVVLQTVFGPKVLGFFYLADLGVPNDQVPTVVY